jgi:hypothetical protein
VIGQDVQITVGQAITNPVLITIPLGFSVPVPPRILDIRRLDGAVQLDCRTVPGQVYQVEFSPDLATWTNAGPAFSAVAPQTPWTDDGTHTGSAPDTVPRRFYRVREL